MNQSLAEYKKFIDDLVEIRVNANWVKERGWPKVPENEKYNELLDGLNLEQKDILAEIIKKSWDAGIHDVLAYLSDEINLKRLRISRNGIELAIEPYGTENYFDWVCRCEGDEWPEHQLDEKYK